MGPWRRSSPGTVRLPPVPEAGAACLLGWLRRSAMLEVSTSQATIQETIRQAQLRLLKMHFESGVGHIGGNLSALDTLLCLYHHVLQADDAFVLSKGHAAGALYVTLWTCGRLADEDLRQFHQDGTRLSGHPPTKGIPEILFATGSLGHGL